MFKTLIRLLFRLIVLAGLAVGVRLALKQWVEGPDPDPVRESWPRAVPTPTAPAAPRTQASQAPAPTSTALAGEVKATGAPASNSHGSSAPDGKTEDRTRPTKARRPDRPLRANRTTSRTPASTNSASTNSPGATQRSTNQGSTTQTPAGSSGTTWIAPGDDGSAPDSHPVKAKVGSRVYRTPEMATYDSTRPDRCYPTAEDAEADGFHRAKR